MKKEIMRSIKFLKDKANIETQHYSYPEGQAIDFDRNVVQFLKKNRIKCCPSAIYGQNDNLLKFFILSKKNIGSLKCVELLGTSVKNTLKRIQ